MGDFFVKSPYIYGARGIFILLGFQVYPLLIFKLIMLVLSHKPRNV